MVRPVVRAMVRPSRALQRSGQGSGQGSGQSQGKGKAPWQAVPPAAKQPKNAINSVGGERESSLPKASSSNTLDALNDIRTEPDRAVVESIPLFASLCHNPCV